MISNVCMCILATYIIYFSIGVSLFYKSRTYGSMCFMLFQVQYWGLTELRCSYRTEILQNWDRELNFSQKLKRCLTCFIAAQLCALKSIILTASQKKRLVLQGKSRRDLMMIAYRHGQCWRRKFSFSLHKKTIFYFPSVKNGFFCKAPTTNMLQNLRNTFFENTIPCYMHK